jgi:hypothetical protein
LSFSFGKTQRGDAKVINVLISVNNDLDLHFRTCAGVKSSLKWIKYLFISKEIGQKTRLDRAAVTKHALGGRVCGRYGPVTLDHHDALSHRADHLFKKRV